MQEEGRAYEFGINQIVIPYKVIDALKDWNLNKPFDTSYDRRVTVALLLVCAPFDTILSQNVSKDAKNFIESKFKLYLMHFIWILEKVFTICVFSTGFMEVRCRADPERMKEIGAYIEDYCQRKVEEDREK